MGYAPWRPRRRIGELITTDVGESLMPLATGAALPWRELAKSSHDGLRESEVPRGFDVVASTREFADAAEASTQGYSLDLELRAPDGSVIPTESICIQDTHYLLEIARELADDIDSMLDDDDASELAASIEHDAALLDEWFEHEGPDLTDVGIGDEPWQESPFPRYQIMVRLVDDASVP